MDLSLLLKIAAFGIVVSLAGSVLKQMGRDDYGQLVTVTGVLIVLTMVAGLVGKFFSMVEYTFGTR